MFGPKPYYVREREKEAEEREKIFDKNQTQEDKDFVNFWMAIIVIIAFTIAAIIVW